MAAAKFFYSIEINFYIDRMIGGVCTFRGLVTFYEIDRLERTMS